MKAEKVKGVALIVCVAASLFVSCWFVPVSVGPTGGRDIQVYVVDAVDSRSSYVGSTSAVRDGINAARVDARDRTKVKLAGEDIPDPIIVSSAADLEYYVNHPPEHAVFINTHGETVPMPGSYISPMLSIVSPSEGQVIDANVTGRSVTVQAVVKTFGGGPLAGLPSMTWEEPSGTYSLPPEKRGPVPLSLVDPVNSLYQYTVDLYFTFMYEFSVSAVTVRGYRATGCVSIDYRGFPTPNPFCLGPDRGMPVPTCPYVLPWDGSGFSVDNNVLLGAGNSSTDYYRLEKPLVRDGAGNFVLRLEESGSKRDFLDCVRLLAVDHPRETGVFVDVDGKIYGCGGLRAPKSARFNGRYTVLCYVSAQEGVGYPFWSCDRLELEFGGLNGSSVARLVLRTCSDEGCVVSVKRPDDLYGWVTLAQVPSRAFWGTSIVDLTGWLPELTSGRLLLSFSGHCEVDFAGLDVSPEVNVTVTEGELVYANDSTGFRATFGDLLREDGVCARLEHGYTVDLGFRLPVLNGSGLERDFILVAKGYVVEGSGLVAGFGEGFSSSVSVAWKDWFNAISDCCRTKGWVWANVAGYSFYYFGTEAYWNMQPEGYKPWLDPNQPWQEGLKQFMDKDVRCNTSVNGPRLAHRDYDFTKYGFQMAYPNLTANSDVYASRPFNKGSVLPWDALGYVDPYDGSHATVAIVMNRTIMGAQTLPGILVHSGMSEDTNRDGLVDSKDDWLKGYIATAMAIEEARSIVVEPALLTQSYGNTHAAAFMVSRRPGDWGRDHDGRGHFSYVNLELLVGAHYDDWDPYPYTYYYFLSQAEVEITNERANEWFVIDRGKSGLDTGDKNLTLMNDLYWWSVSTEAGALPKVGGLLGPAIDLLPIIVGYFQPPVFQLEGDHVWAKEIIVDPNSDCRGTTAVFVQVRFYGNENPANTDYAFTMAMTSWIGWMYTETGYIYWREASLQFSKQLTFTAFEWS